MEPPDGLRSTLSAFLEGAMARSRSANTLRAYRRCGDKLVDFLHAHAVERFEDAPAPTLGAFAQHLAEQGGSTSSQEQHLSVARGLYRWLQQEGRTEQDLGEQVFSTRSADTLATVLEPVDVDRVLAAKADPKTKAMLSLFGRVGAKPGELGRLRWEHLDHAAGRVTLLGGVGSADRTVPMGSKTQRLLQGLLAEVGFDTPSSRHVFSDPDGTPWDERRLRRRVRRVAEELDLPTLTATALRKAHAAKLEALGAGPGVIQDRHGFSHRNSAKRALRRSAARSFCPTCRGNRSTLDACGQCYGTGFLLEPDHKMLEKRSLSALVKRLRAVSTEVRKQAVAAERGQLGPADQVRRMARLGAELEHLAEDLTAPGHDEGANPSE